jgi:hypothetical protein
VVYINVQGAPDCLYGYACYLTATADAPTGPFTYMGAARTKTNSSWGDFDLFVDDDGSGFLIGTRIGGGVPAGDARREGRAVILHCQSLSLIRDPPYQK